MVAKLLVRPTAHADEWVWSWVARTARGNGLTSLHPLALSQCAELMQGVPNQLALPVQELSTKPKATTTCFGGVTLPGRFVRKSLMVLRVCPACIRDAGYVRQHWQLLGCEICPQHGSVLRKACACCVKKFGLQEALQRTCSCGQPIFPQHADAATEREVKLAKVFAWASSTVSEVSLKVFAWELLIQVARARRGRDIALADRRWGDHAAEWLQMHDMLFEATEAGIGTFLLKLPDPIHQVTATTWLTRLLEKERAEPTAMGQLPLQGWLDALRKSGAPVQRDRQLGSKSQPPKMPGYLPLQVAARRLQISTPRLRQWVTDGHLAAVPVPSANHPFLMVREQDVQHCNRLHAQESPRARPLRAPWLGDIGRCARRQLRIGGLMDSTGSSRSAHDMPVGKLLERVTAQATPRGVTSVPLVQLSDQRWWSWHGAEARCQGRQEAGDGKRPVFRDEEVSGFDGLYTSADQILSLHRLSVGLRRADKTPVQADLFGGLTPPLAREVHSANESI